jgi:hypothetical protein
MASSRKPRKTPCFIGFFRNSRIRDRHVNDCIYAMDTAGTMPAACPPGGPGGRWPRGPGPTGRRGPRPAAAAAMPFSLSLPAPHRGGGGHNTSRERSDPPHRPVRAASPPGDHSGAERPGGRARRPPDPVRMARPIDSGTCCRHDAYSRRAGCWSGPAPNVTGAGCPRAVELPSGEVCPRQRVLSAPTGPSWPHCVVSPASCRLEVFHRRAPPPRDFGLLLWSRIRFDHDQAGLTAAAIVAEVRVAGGVRAGRAGGSVTSGRDGRVRRAGGAAGPGRASGCGADGARTGTAAEPSGGLAGVAGGGAVALQGRGPDARGTAARCPARRPARRSVRAASPRAAGRPTRHWRAASTASASSAGRRPAGLAREGLEPPGRGGRRRAGRRARGTRRCRWRRPAGSAGRGRHRRGPLRWKQCRSRRRSPAQRRSRRW